MLFPSHSANYFPVGRQLGQVRRQRPIQPPRGRPRQTGRSPYIGRADCPSVNSGYAVDAGRTRRVQSDLAGVERSDTPGLSVQRTISSRRDGVLRMIKSGRAAAGRFRALVVTGMLSRGGSIALSRWYVGRLRTKARTISRLASDARQIMPWLQGVRSAPVLCAKANNGCFELSEAKRPVESTLGTL